MRIRPAPAKFYARNKSRGSDAAYMETWHDDFRLTGLKKETKNDVTPPCDLPRMPRTAYKFAIRRVVKRAWTN